MDIRIKNSLGAIGIIAIATVAYAGLIYARAYSQSIEPASFRSFAVSGEGKVTAVPDIAQFTFGVVTQGGKDIATGQKTTTNKMNALIDFIKSQGVDAKDIKTEQFSIDPRYQYYDCSQRMVSSVSAPTPCPPPDIVGYTITQSASVKIRDFAKIGDIMGALSGKGANSVSQLTFTLDDPIKAEMEARDKAIAQAKEKADAIAKAGNFSIGKLLSIEEGATPTPYYGYGMGGDSMKTMSLAAAPVNPTIEAGSQDVKVTISLRYEIQ